MENRLRQKEAAIVEKDAAANDYAFTNVGQCLEHGVIPEQQLQKQREVADDLDIAAGNFRQQPIARQSRYTNEKAENGRKEDADPGNQQRVEKANPEGTAVSGTSRRILDQSLADVEASCVVPESETGCDVSAGEIIDRIAGGTIDEKADHCA